MKHIPATPEEMKALGWKKADIILITGDALIDSSYVGVAVIARVLLDAGYRVAVIPQPDIRSPRDVTRLGEPEIFWGVSSGCVDSMISNHTPTRKPRKADDLTPGGRNTRRPDRAVIVYSNLIRRYFKNTRPIVLGGIEASLRRVSHYDYWSDSVKRSILFDAKADVLVYGMGEQTVTEVAETLRKNEDIGKIRGICHIRKDISDMASHFPLPPMELPSHEEVARDKRKFAEMFDIFYRNTDPLTAAPLCQKQDTRHLVQNPPRFPPTSEELDRIFELPYTREVHPHCEKDGPVRALETIRFSLTTHRGCYGECRFCAISVHQGRRIAERTEASLLREAERMTRHPDFKGVISDVGGPTANMYGMECPRKKSKGACRNRHCLFPTPCKHLPLNHSRQTRLLGKLRKIPGVRKVFVGSGIRHDLIIHDEKFGEKYLEQVVRHHVSGQMKIAPEHSQDAVLRRMGKPGPDMLIRFKKRFDAMNRKIGKKQFLTYYFMAAYPGCAFEDMRELRKFAEQKLRLLPEQVQIFTPSPSTYATLMYHTGSDPFTNGKLFVEKDNRKKEKQKNILCKGARGKGERKFTNTPEG